MSHFLISLGPHKPRKEDGTGCVIMINISALTDEATKAQRVSVFAQGHKTLTWLCQASRSGLLAFPLAPHNLLRS